MASMMTFGSWEAASSMAAGNSCQLSTLEMPIEEPPRAGLTNTGRPSSSRSSSVSSARPCRTTSGPVGMLASRAIFLVNSLSMPAAEASTPLPT